MRRVRAELRGIVQGVGFRPFVHNLAERLALSGHVFNSSSGLTAEVEGPDAAVQEFLGAVVADAPPLAWVRQVETAELAPQGGAGFEIRPSVGQTGEFALISPDIATCAECLRDIGDPENRRFGYAFTNCTNCGPRYSIIRDIPYDRVTTTMAPFQMCAACLAEYEDPRNRRYHAQPNACPVCGPALSAPVAEARRRLAAGEIVALKGIGGFHLACDARNSAAVRLLRERKRRSDKPFALMVRDLATVAAICEISDAAPAALTSPSAPIVILRRLPSANIPEEVAPGNRTLGVMLPYTPLHHLLFADAPYDALVMTSGNLSEEPIVVSNAEAHERLGGVADWFLTHNRDIYMRVDDSVVRTFAGQERVLRRSRGYAPRVLDLIDRGRRNTELLACGGELKNAFCLTKRRHAIMSQHIGDLENYETLLFFQETLANLKKLFRVEPQAVAHDLHPSYLGTRYALDLGLPAVGVQHHHAHVASCMAENGLDGDVIGVAFDGTGYGTDGAIWGGEFLVAGYGGFERRAHLRYVQLAGGDAAIREPWRSGLSYLMDAFGPDVPFAQAPESAVRLVRQMISKGVATVPTSSCGRLFDAVASIIGLCQLVTFEGQAAIELEAIADPAERGCYPYGIEPGDSWQVDFRPAIRGIAAEAEQGTPPPVIAARFHNTLADSIVSVCARLRAETGLRRACLSGGTFQNVTLVERVIGGLGRAGIDVYLHSKVPPNDGGIALGQAAIAVEKL